jgi:lysophospholipase L1-like esterase
MEWFEDEVRWLEHSATRAKMQQQPVAFYGSSSIRLWGTLEKDFPAFHPVNLGFGGSTLEACSHFFKRIVPPCKPRSMVIYAGDNDLGDGRSPEQVLDALRTLLNQVDEFLGPIPVAFLAIKPSPARWYIHDRIRRTNEITQAEMKQRSAGLFIDVYPKMLTEDRTPRLELYESDGLHLSPLGYQLWTNEISAHSTFLL